MPNLEVQEHEAGHYLLNIHKNERHTTLIRLYQGSGASEIELVGAPTPREDWAQLRRSVCRLLRARKTNRAAKLLESIPFDL